MVPVPVASNLLSILLLIFGSNNLPPKEPHLTKGATCPVVTPQSFFNIKDILRTTFYVNYGTSYNDEPKKFNCITLGIEKKIDGNYLRLVGIRVEDGKRERAWHKLKIDENGHCEIDLRVNDDKQQGKAYLYYDQYNPTRKLHIYVCIKFLNSSSHAEGAIIATENKVVSPIPLSKHLEDLKRITNAQWNEKGLLIRNDCPPQGPEYITGPSMDQPVHLDKATKLKSRKGGKVENQDGWLKFE